MNSSFASAIYRGKVRHRRFSPKQHEFEYDVFMMYLDTSEIETIFSLSPLWSLSRFAPARYKRSDFHIDGKHADLEGLPSIDESVRNTVESAIGERPNGPIRMLVNIRYWGFNMNPLSTYYCFDSAGENVIAILAEVNNTPWDERHAYVLTGSDFSTRQHVRFQKKLHVSPFNPMDMDYNWQSTTPSKTLALHLENWQNQQKITDATLTLNRETINQSSLNKILIHFPWMTVKIISAIYWQALKLWWKGVPIFNHEKVIDKDSPFEHKNNCVDLPGNDSRGNRV
ncbi:MAG: DUF1365 domain-containing protein [Gammaproteobacteria bacterium]|nr:MAG: DUF1365 domain-containing protein [Gammaproteobacteria bacterium]